MSFLSRPGYTGLGNYLVPLQRRRDVAFPRANAMSYWLYLFGVLIVVSSFFVAGGPAAVAWTAYAPLSTSEFFQGTGMDLWIIGLAVVGVAGILGAVNLVTTIFRMRMPGMRCSDPCHLGVLVNAADPFAFPPDGGVSRCFLERNFGRVLRPTAVAARAVPASSGSSGLRVLLITGHLRDHPARSSPSSPASAFCNGMVFASSASLPVVRGLGRKCSHRPVYCPSFSIMSC